MSTARSDHTKVARGQSVRNMMGCEGDKTGGRYSSEGMVLLGMAHGAVGRTWLFFPINKRER